MLNSYGTASGIQHRRLDSGRPVLIPVIVGFLLCHVGSSESNEGGSFFTDDPWQVFSDI